MIHRTIRCLARLCILLALAICTRTLHADELRDDWASAPDRTWIGPDFWANRLQDWRLHDGRLECVEGRDRQPLRTLIALTAFVGHEGFEARVRTGSLDAPAAPSARGWRGFLVGAGGNHVDSRLSALVHHRPAEDGGLLAVVDSSGQVAFRDNSRTAGKGGLWSINGPLAENEAPVLGRTVPRAFDGTLPDEIDLRLTASRDGDRWTLTLAALDDEGRVVSEAVLEDAPERFVTGGFGLVSHLGPKGSKRGHWFRDLHLHGPGVRRAPEARYGPVLCAQYTLSGGTLKLTAQFGPLGAEDTTDAHLEVQRRDGSWHRVASAVIVPDSWTAPFRVEGWDATRDQPYRVTYDLVTGHGKPATHHAAGTIRREPVDKDEMVIASLNCHKIYTGGLRWNHNGIWFPHGELVRHVRAQAPDLLFFAGDQIYEGDLNGVDLRNEEIAILDYLYKWYRWCWAFGELTRELPTVTIPDDHDVYHGNIWGAGGKKAQKQGKMSAQDSGGYKRSPRFVNAVHRTQTSHLPDAVDPAPIKQNISVYFTRLDYGGVSCAILADRQFKSAPAVTVPEGQVVNGWFQNPDFDPATQADVEGAVLLGERQLAFLDDWAVDFGGDTWMKVVLSQTIFANVATLPEGAKSGSVIPGLPYLESGEYPDNYRLACDTDSNGWPQTGRNRAVRAFRRGLAIHLAGDQHLGSMIQYGVDEWRDAGFAFCAPAIANTWPRRWYPPQPGRNREPGWPPYAGDYRDGFGNHMTVYAVANPVKAGREPANLYNRAPGYGIVRLRRAEREIVFECWPRWVDPTAADAHQYDGWPLVVDQFDNGPGEAGGTLPPIEVSGIGSFVVKVTDERSGAIEYALRVDDDGFIPSVAGPGPYTIEIGDPDTGRWMRRTHVRPAGDGSTTVLQFAFD